jgi:hypothetical protein
LLFKFNLRRYNEAQLGRLGASSRYSFRPSAPLPTPSSSAAAAAAAAGPAAAGAAGGAVSLAESTRRGGAVYNLNPAKTLA